MRATTWDCRSIWDEDQVHCSTVGTQNDNCMPTALRAGLPAIFEPTCANARWAHMHHFASVSKITRH